MYFACVSGSGVKDYASQARGMARYGENCDDYVLVFGGWGSSRGSDAHLAESVSELMEFRHSKILMN